MNVYSYFGITFKFYNFYCPLASVTIVVGSPSIGLSDLISTDKFGTPFPSGPRALKFIIKLEVTLDNITLVEGITTFSHFSLSVVNL